MGRPMTSEVFSLKARGERTRKGWMSRISRPTCGLQSIQMMSCRSGIHVLRLLLAVFVAVTNAQPPAFVQCSSVRRRAAWGHS